MPGFRLHTDTLLPSREQRPHYALNSKKIFELFPFQRCCGGILFWRTRAEFVKRLANYVVVNAEQLAD